MSVCVRVSGMRRLSQLFALPRVRALCSSVSSSASSAAAPAESKDALFLRALHSFAEREGHFSVPPDFVVPADSSAWPAEAHGLDLGRRLRLFTRGRCGEHKRAQLRGIGFPYDDWRTYVWEEQVLPSLRAFRAIEGHAFVRQTFQVPRGDSRWPRAAWGFKLGSHCQLLRREKSRSVPPAQVAQLDAVGFVWSDAEWKRAEFVLPALAVFRALFGHSAVPPRFVVPSDDARWPSKSRGYPVGRLVAQIDEDELSLAHKRELDALDFFDAELPATVWRERVFPALETFAHVYSHTDIVTDFVVPHEPPWPTAAYGLALGYVVAHINASGLFEAELPAHKLALKTLGYRWEALFGRWSKQLLPALKRFYELHGHCDVPQMFQVPTTDATWPASTWGYRLGKQVSLMRRGGRYALDVVDVLDELDSMGFSFNVLESTFVQKVMPALEAYAHLYGDCNVPQGFVVPSDDTRWPKRSWGIKLGHVIRNIRSRKQHAEQVEEHRERLAELGFVWRLNDTSMGMTTRDIVQPYLDIYAQLYGPGDVPRDFVIPVNDELWPESSRGFRLGAWLQRYSERERGLLPFQTRDGRLASQKRQRRIAPTGTLSPFQDEYWRDVLLASFQAYASLHSGTCADMDDGFVVPSEAPYPPQAWGLNLSLRLRHIRHGLRYADEVAKYKDDLETIGIVGSADSDKNDTEEEDEEDEEGDAYDEEDDEQSNERH